MGNLLSEIHPELISEWSNKNLPLTPDRESIFSVKFSPLIDKRIFSRFPEKKLPQPCMEYTYPSSLL